MKMHKPTITYKSLFFISLIVLIALILPVILVGRYMVPAGDDFSFSAETYHALSDGKSVLLAAFEKTAEVYHSWQGSFAAVFLMTLQPGIFGYSFYGITTVVMISSLVAGLYLFFKAFLHDFFGCDKYGAFLVASIVSIMCSQFLPLAYQSFFWYNASVYYTFFFALVLITASITIRYILFGGKARFVLITIFSFIIGGGNYITALISLISLALGILYLVRIKNKKYVSLLLPFFLLLSAFIISAVSPGNGVRQMENPIHPGPIAAIIASIKYAFAYIKIWSDSSFFAMVVILCPVLWHLASGSSRKFSFPLLHTLISFLLFASMFCPHTYAMGSPGPGRILNIIYFAYLTIVTINLYLWFGFLSSTRSCNSRDRVNLIPLIICAFVSCALLFYSVKSGCSITSVLAINELQSGEAENYYLQNSFRFDAMLNSDDEEFTFASLSSKPVLLFSEDLKDDPDNYMNRDMASYFGKKSITVK